MKLRNKLQLHPVLERTNLFKNQSELHTEPSSDKLRYLKYEREKSINVTIFK